MAGKKDGEEQAWKEYIDSIEGKGKSNGKGVPIGKRLQALLERFGIGKKAAEKKAVQKEIEISAAEGKKLFEEEVEKPEEAKTPVAEEAVEKRPALAKVEGKKPVPFLQRMLGRKDKTPAEKTPVEKKIGLDKKEFGKPTALPKKSLADSLKKIDADALKRIEEEIKKERKEKTVAKKKPLAIEKYIARVEGQKKMAEEMQKFVEKPAAEKAIAKPSAEKETGKPEAKPEKPFLQRVLGTKEEKKEFEKKPAAEVWKRPEKKKAVDEKELGKAKKGKKRTKEKEKPIAVAEKAGKGKEELAEEVAVEEEERPTLSKRIALMPKKAAEKVISVSKKLAFLPKAEKKTRARKGRARAIKKAAVKKGKAGGLAGIGKAVGRIRRGKPVKEIKGRKALKPAEQAALAAKVDELLKKLPKAKLSKKMISETLEQRPSLAKKSVAEIRKMSPKAIEEEIKREKIAITEGGWFGDSLRHQKAAVSGWRLRKRVKLHQLKKKKKKRKKLSAREERQFKRLVVEDKGYREKLEELEKRIRSLKAITAQKKKEEKILEKKAKAVGVDIPVVKIPKAKARKAGKKTTAPRKEKAPRKEEDMKNLVEAIKGMANEMAATSAKQAAKGSDWENSQGFEDKIRTQQNMIKHLELAFYKRKVDFDQFREKMFEYQAKLSELKIKKKVAQEREAKMPPEMREAMRKYGTFVPPTKIGITPTTAAALEKMTAKMPEEVKLGEKTAEAIQKLTKKEAERAAKDEVKRTEEQRFSERTAAALQKIAEKLAAMPRAPPQAPPQPAAQAGQAPASPTPAPGQGPAPKPPEESLSRMPSRPEREEDYRPKRRERREEEYAPPRRPRYEEEEYEPPRRRPRHEDEEELPRRKKRRRARVFDEEEEEIEERIEESTGKEKKEHRGFSERIVERIREKVVHKPEEGEGPSRPVSRELDNAIKQKAVGSSLDKQQVDRIEKRLGELLRKYHIPDRTLASHIKTLDSNRLVQDFQKLITLIESKRESAAAELIRPAPGFDIKSGIISRKREKVVGKEKEIHRAKIETSFDRVLSLVQIKGIINLNEVAKQLGMNRKEVQECSEILERSRLIKLVYPPIGSVKLVYPPYLKWKQQQKTMMAERKKK